MFQETFRLKPGITAVIGGGGKTTFLRQMGEELSRDHSVLLYTSTKYFHFPDLPCAESLEEVDCLRKTHRLFYAGQKVPGLPKLQALDVPIAELARRFDYILVEADGSAQLPMKAHHAHEPVIPEGTAQTVYLIGASGFGRPISEAAHRPERYAELAGVGLDAPITPETEAAVLKAEGYGDIFLVNQAESEEAQAAATGLAALMEKPVYAVSLKRGEVYQ